jgi:hypothetical protein
MNEDIRAIQAERKIQSIINVKGTANDENSQYNLDEGKLRKELSDLDNKPNKKISCGDVAAILKYLKQKVNKKDIEEMVWEVDEDLDECIDWNEFRKMFCRNAVDKTGLEVSKMFNLTQFLIYDHNMNGRVSVDETMNMLYAR